MAKYTKVGDNLLLNTETGVYYVRKAFRKDRIPDLFKSTGEERINKAKILRDQMITAHLAKYLHGEVSGRDAKTFSEVADEVLRYESPDQRKSTQDQYRRYIGELKTEFGEIPITRVTSEFFTEWLREFRKRKTRKTFMDYQKYASKVLTYAYQKRYVTHQVKFKNPDRGRATRYRVYTREEITSLWNHMDEDLRDQFALGFECMMRLREILHLTWDRVDLDTGTIILRADDVKTGSKTGRGRTFRVSPNALARLKARRAITPGANVFPSPVVEGKSVNQNKTAWKHAKEKAGIEGNARFHDLRHTAISIALLEAHITPVLVSQYAGVSIRTIEKVYLHSDSQKTQAVSNAIRIDQTQ